MFMALTDDQKLIAETARNFVERHAPVTRLRALRDSADPLGYSSELWRKMAELGWVGMALPAEHGGGGMGLAELALVLEALGRALAPEPFLSTVLLAGSALALGGSDAQQAQWLPRICAGEARLAWAHDEPQSRFRRTRVTTRAVASDDGFRLTGVKDQVLDAAGADALIVSARLAESDDDRAGIGLFLVASTASGLTVTPQPRLDSRSAAHVTLTDVSVGPADALSATDAAALVDAVLDRAIVGLCAEMLGGMSATCERTIDYLKERRQFGVAIGTFQALQHRAARLFTAVELCRSAVMAAARAVDEAAPDAAQLVSMAKAQCSEAYLHVAHEAVQLHGGIGMTDELDLGFYLKRARACELTLGDATWHRDRWAQLRGY